MPLTGHPPLTIHLLKTGLAGAGHANLKPSETQNIELGSRQDTPLKEKGSSEVQSSYLVI